MKLATLLWCSADLEEVDEFLRMSELRPTHWHSTRFLRQRIDGSDWIGACRGASLMLSRTEHPRAHLNLVDAAEGLVGILIESDEGLSDALCATWEAASDNLVRTMQPDLGASWLSLGQGPILRETDVGSRRVTKVFPIIYIDPARHDVDERGLAQVGATTSSLGAVVKVASSPLCARDASTYEERLNAVKTVLAGGARESSEPDRRTKSAG